jgi:phospholipid/cholesterol/gamma-HCH transport system substrate-binding protein
MYVSRFTQLIVGLFALLGIAALVYLSVRLGNVTLFPVPGYTLYADFDNISGLKIGDQVQIAGVPVGKVQLISLKDNRAHVAMRVNNGVEIDAGAFAAVKTSGIIGDKYISVELGPGEQSLRDGGTIQHTQSAFVLEDAIGQLINGSGSSSGSSRSAPGAPGAGAEAAQGTSSGGNPFPSVSGPQSGSNPGNCNCSGQNSNKK